jgi:hypothetical protein
VITANPNDPTGNEAIGAEYAVGEHAGSPLRAWTQNGALHVGGLIPGQSWSVYSLTGTLIYQSIANSGEVEIALPARSSTKLTNHGLYIVMSGSRTIKVIN